VYLCCVTVRGFRSAAMEDVTCKFPGRFSLLIGASNVGKTTVADALYLAHPYFRGSRDRLLLSSADLFLVRSRSSTCSARQARRRACSGKRSPTSRCHRPFGFAS
jgi:recombinational DNA repair ATPase RecF